MTLDIRVGKYALTQANDLDDDPRGLVHVFEEPRATSNYVVAADPSYGITGWHRLSRSEDDIKTDNGAVEVIRCGTGGRPDVQVAEYAAPIDAEDLAAVVNFLGRMYKGASEEEGALAIIEVQPGPGLLTQRELINRFGYTNLFVWQHLDQRTTQMTRSYGWYSSRQSRQMLWIRGTRHITQRKITLASPWLVEEMTDLVLDNWLNFTARAQWGAHDDRCVALLLGIWAANQWTFDNAPEEAAPATVVNAIPPQATDMSAEELYDSWADRFDALRGE